MSRRDKAGCEHCRSTYRIRRENPRRGHREKGGDRRMGILKVKHEYLLIGHGMGADFEQVELREGSGCKKSDSCYPGRALSNQMELSRQGGIDHRHLGAGVQQKVVGTGMVYGYLHDHPVAVYKTEGYTCDISRAMRFCGKCWDDGSGKNEGSEPLEGRHFELLSRPG